MPGQCAQMRHTDMGTIHAEMCTCQWGSKTGTMLSQPAVASWEGEVGLPQPALGVMLKFQDAEDTDDMGRPA
eukprot:428229-Pelagomonas_calceolata.AAC.3